MCKLADETIDELEEEKVISSSNLSEAQQWVDKMLGEGTCEFASIGKEDADAMLQMHNDGENIIELSKAMLFVLTEARALNDTMFPSAEGVINNVNSAISKENQRNNIDTSVL